MRTIVEMKFGSHLYGTNTENSDLDLKGIYLPSKREILLGTAAGTISTQRPKQHGERNNKDDVDVELLSLKRYMDLLLDGQVMALDMLFAPKEFILKDVGYIWSSIKTNKDKFLHRGVSAYTGYARQQAAKYGLKGFRVAAFREVLNWLSSQEDHKRLSDTDVHSFVTALNNNYVRFVSCKGPNNTEIEHLEVGGKKVQLNSTVKYITNIFQRQFDEYGKRALLAEKNEGCDFKALSHAVRVNSQAKELLLHHTMTFPRPDRQLLLDIKLGKIHYKEVADIIERGLEDVLEAQKVSTLQEAPMRDTAETIILNAYEEQILEGLYYD